MCLPLPCERCFYPLYVFQSHQEAVVFTDLRGSYETWKLLPQLDARVALYFIFSGKDATKYVLMFFFDIVGRKFIVDVLFSLGGVEAARELVWRRVGNSSNVLVPSAGHLVSCFPLSITPEPVSSIVVLFS